MKSFCVGIFAVLAVFAGTAFAKTSTHDQFYELFKSRVPIPQILAACYDKDAATQYQHLEAIQKHIDDQDEYADYANELKTAAQGILDNSLQSIGHGHVDIEEYTKAVKDIEAGETVENEDLVNVINTLKQRKEKMATASEDEKIAHLNQMMNSAPKAETKHHHNSHRKIRIISSTPSTEEASEE